MNTQSQKQLPNIPAAHDPSQTPRKVQEYNPKIQALTATVNLTTKVEYYATFSPVTETTGVFVPL